MGILSNTCITHLEYCRRRFAWSALFRAGRGELRGGDAQAGAGDLSLCRQRAGVAAKSVFADDIAANVEAASAAGFDAVRFTSARQLAAELRKRKIPMNL